MLSREYVTRPAVIPEQVINVHPGSSGSLGFAANELFVIIGVYDRSASKMSALPRNGTPYCGSVVHSRRNRPG
jgi:hypothetical protein